VTQPRAADDFPAIRARMEELQRERARVPADDDLRRADGPYAISSKPALAVAIGRALLKVRTA